MRSKAQAVRNNILISVRISTGLEEVERCVNLPQGATYYQLLDILGINPETVVIKKDGSPVPRNDVVLPGDIEIIQVVSAG